MQINIPKQLIALYSVLVALLPPFKKPFFSSPLYNIVNLLLGKGKGVPATSSCQTQGWCSSLFHLLTAPFKIYSKLKPTQVSGTRKCQKEPSLVSNCVQEWGLLAAILCRSAFLQCKSLVCNLAYLEGNSKVGIQHNSKLFIQK